MLFIPIRMVIQHPFDSYHALNLLGFVGTIPLLEIHELSLMFFICTRSCSFKSNRQDDAWRVTVHHGQLGRRCMAITKTLLFYGTRISFGFLFGPKLHRRSLNRKHNTAVLLVPTISLR